MSKKLVTLTTLSLTLAACGPVLQWKSVIEGASTSGAALAVTTDSTNNTYQLYPVGTQLTLRKLDPKGKVVWAKAVDDSLTDSNAASHLKLTAGGVVVGYGTGTTAAYLRSFDGAGNVLWTSDLGTHTAETLADVVVGSDGSTTVSIKISGTKSNVVRVDASGAVAWDKVIPACSLYCVNAIAIDSTGKVLATQAEASATKSHLLDASGALLWSKSRSTGLSLNGIVASQATPTAKGFVVTHPVATWEYDQTGTQTWTVAFGGKARVARTAAGNLMVANGSKITTLDASGVQLSEIVLDKVETVTQLEWREDSQRVVALTNSREQDLTSVVGSITDRFWPSLWTFDATGKQLAKYNGALTLTSGTACTTLTSCSDITSTPGDLWTNFSVTSDKKIVVSGLIKDTMRYASAYTLK